MLKFGKGLDSGRFIFAPGRMSAKEWGFSATIQNREALASGKPAVVEVLIDAQFGTSGGQASGWWDVPVRVYLTECCAACERNARKR
jgi:hypothetical protein